MSTGSNTWHRPTRTPRRRYGHSLVLTPASGAAQHTAASRSMPPPSTASTRCRSGLGLGPRQGVAHTTPYVHAGECARWDNKDTRYRDGTEYCSGLVVLIGFIGWPNKTFRKPWPADCFQPARETRRLETVFNAVSLRQVSLFQSYWFGIILYLQSSWRLVNCQKQQKIITFYQTTCTVRWPSRGQVRRDSVLVIVFYVEFDSQ